MRHLMGGASPLGLIPWARRKGSGAGGGGGGGARTYGALSTSNPHSSGDRRGLMSMRSVAAFGSSNGTGRLNSRHVLDGSQADAGFFYATTGHELIFDFGWPTLVTSATMTQSTTASHGTWQWEGSNDDATYTAIGATFTLGGALTHSFTTLGANATRYQYLKLKQVSGTASATPYIREFTFNCDVITDLATTAYTNAGGQGNRTGIITVSVSPANLFTGTPSTIVDGALTDVLFFNGAHTAGEITFDFGSPKIITEANFHQSVATYQGDWKWRGSNDGSTWTDIGAVIYLGASALTSHVITTLNYNKTAYRHYQLKQVSGVTSPSPYIRDIEFKISA